MPFFVIAGPTACGKSELAVRVAEKCGAEIVGADAFQIYEGLDLLTAKPSGELRERVRHHLVGEVPLGHRFNVGQFAGVAGERIADIRRRGKVAIVCGGTGLYLRSLLHGLADLPGADAALRERLEGEPIEDLRRQLATLDPEAAATIDLQNPRRVVRALEVCLLTGRPFSSFRSEWQAAASSLRGIVLVRDRADLHRRIADRTAAMFAAGVVEEVRQTGEVGPTAESAIGYREIRDLLAGRIGEEQCRRSIEESTRQYAKRQMTWFRREPALEPINLSDSTDLDALVGQLAEAAKPR